MDKEPLWKTLLLTVAYGVGLMSGLFSIGRKGLTLYRPDFAPPTAVFQVCSVACLVVSCLFIVWRLRTRITFLETKLDAKTPVINGEVTECQMTMGRDCTHVTIECEMYSRNTVISVKAYRVAVTDVNGDIESIDVAPITVRGPLILNPGIHVKAPATLTMSGPGLQKLDVSAVDAYGNCHPLKFSVKDFPVVNG